MQHYKFSQCSLNAIDTWWPAKSPYKDQTPSAFESNMRFLQADLIRCHLPEMNDADRQRALRTLNWLEVNSPHGLEG